MKAISRRQSETLKANTMGITQIVGTRMAPMADAMSDNASMVPKFNRRIGVAVACA